MVTRLDVGSLGTNGFDPIPNGLSDELWAVVRPDAGRNTAQDGQIGQRVDDLRRVQLPFHSYRQAFSAVFVQNIQRPECPAVPACVSQKGRNPTIEITAILARQFDQIRDQAFFISTPTWQSTLCGSALAQNATNSSLRNFELTTNVIDAGATTRRA